MELSVIGSGTKLSVSDSVFDREFSKDLVHQVVVAFRNAGRSGTKAQLTRSEVTGTTKKFKKQKGGGARHGDYRAPIFVGGGVTFAAKPRSFEQKVNRKMYRAAIAAILSERPLIVTETGSDALYLAARNIPYVQVRDVQGLDPVALVGAEHVIMTADAVKKVEEWLA